MHDAERRVLIEIAKLHLTSCHGCGGTGTFTVRDTSDPQNPGIVIQPCGRCTDLREALKAIGG